MPDTMPQETRRVKFEPGAESIVEAIVSSVARIQAVEPNRLPPLGRAFDAELLERLFEPSMGERAESGHLTFQYAGVSVTVDLEGELRFAWE